MSSFVLSSICENAYAYLLISLSNLDFRKMYALLFFIDDSIFKINSWHIQRRVIFPNRNRHLLNFKYISKFRRANACKYIPNEGFDVHNVV